MEPQVYSLPHSKVIFPRDSDAGGTWIATNENGNTVVFLNGAWVKHEPLPPYQKSRGLVLLDMVDSDSPLTYFLKSDLKQIEPFTAIVYESEELYECRWDGNEKYHAKLDKSQAHIWSSATLYDEAVVKKREAWFEQWLRENPSPSQEDIFHFHQFTGDGDTHNDLLMDRDGMVSTVSITSVELEMDLAKMRYQDIKKGTQNQYELSLTKATAS